MNEWKEKQHKLLKHKIKVNELLVNTEIPLSCAGRENTIVEVDSAHRIVKSIGEEIEEGKSSVSDGYRMLEIILEGPEKKSPK